jgi:hypothetical protein
MRSVLSAAAIVGLGSLAVSAAPYNTHFPGGKVFPLSNGFPDPNADQTKQIEIQAFGTLSNALPPATISSDGLTNLKLIGLNELFEVAFFTELIFNITYQVPGYEIFDRKERKFILDTLIAVQAVRTNISERSVTG